ncbi:MAG: rRNA maturation RNase YbeY [Aestuariivirgaceae bacterium]
MDVSIAITCDLWDSQDNLEETVLSAATAAFKAAKLSSADLEFSVVLSDDETVAELNQRWRGKNRATNVLSFPAAQTAARGENEPIFAGDIILASGVVSRESIESGKPLATHLSHLIVHGVLHLMGYDHNDDPSAARMQATETDAMALLGLPDPYKEHENTAIAG